MRRIATAAAAAAALLLVPATAVADETVSVAGGVLSYVSGAGTADTVTLSAGPGTDTLLSESTSPSGSVGTACTVYAPSAARCAGATSAVLDTLDGDDTVTLIATIPATVRGGDGADKIIGGPAYDTIDAGDGPDAVDVRGGGVDTVDCGPGDDTIEFDAGLDVLTNCDLPTDPPAPGLPDPVAPATVAFAPAARVAARDVRVGADGVAPLELACPATEADGCAGSIFLDPAPTPPRAYAAASGRYGRGRFDVTAGQRVVVGVTLSRTARAALGLSRPVRARAARRGRAVKVVVTVKEKGKKPVKKKVKLHR